MKRIKKRILGFAILLLWSTVMQFAVPIPYNTSVVATAVTSTKTNNPATNYYYSQLYNSTMAQNFYKALVDMESNGYFKTGNKEYDLIANGILTESEVNSYINNAESTILVAFGAARDAFILDHPALFYVEPSNIGVTLGTQNGKPMATLGTGRDDSYYNTEELLNSEEKINDALEKYQARVNEIAAGAQKNTNPTDMIAYVNQWFYDNVTYDYCEYYDEANQKDTYPFGKDYCNLRGTAYGSLINNRGVCESYARGFKAIMDKLNIPCVLVYGSCAADGGYEPHMWNYVQLDGKWYAIDVTWNTTSKDSQKYYLKGKVDFEHDHMPSGIISASNFEFTYPTLSNYQYGVSEDVAGFYFSPIYSTKDDITTLELSFSYNGKSASKLHEEGIYVAFRTVSRNTTVQDIVLSPWYSTYESDRVLSGFFWESPDTKDTLTTFYLHPGIESIQFMIVTKAPDTSGGATDPETNEPYNYYYSTEEFSSTDMIAISDPCVNNAYGTYIPAPSPMPSSTPVSSISYNANGKYIDCKIVFSEDLVPTDEWVDSNDSSTTASMMSTRAASNSIQVGDATISVEVCGVHSDINDYIDVTDISWNPSEPTIVSFKFKASQQFKHNYESYSFYIHGLVGKISGKTPKPYSLNFSKSYVMCPKVFGDGRVYIVCSGQPQITANEDLSIAGWKDENGNVYSSSQRSQMMLVVSDVDSSDEKDMLNSASAMDNSANILASATYEIDLQICNLYPKIPNGSYLQVSIGFPDGTTYDDFKNGSKTFKMYHYKRGNDGKIDPTLTEEIEIAVTPYGLVAKITDFSPFAIIAYDSNEVPAQKSILASVSSKGGTLKNSGITTFTNDNDTVSYTIVPDDGYQLDRVLVNGEAIKVEGNTLSFLAGDLGLSTMVEVSFVSNRVVEYEKANGITPIQHTIVLNSAADVKEIINGSTETPSNPEAPSNPETPGSTGGTSGTTSTGGSTVPGTSVNPEAPETPDDSNTTTTPTEPVTPEVPTEEAPNGTDSTTQTFNSTKKPTLKATVTKGSKSVTFKWSKVAGADGYRIYQYNSNTGKYERIKTISDQATTTYSKNMSYASSYSFRIRAFKITEDGSKTYGKYSAVINVTTPPNTVTGLKVKSSSTTKVTLSWKKVKNAEGYQIFRSSKKNGTYTRVKTLKKGSTLKATIKQTGKKTYYYKIRAYVSNTDNNRVYGSYCTAISSKS